MRHASVALCASSEVIAYVKSTLLAGFLAQSGSMSMYKMAELNVVTLLGVFGPSQWPECMQELWRLLKSPTTEDLEVCATFVISDSTYFCPSPTQGCWSTFSKALK